MNAKRRPLIGLSGRRKKGNQLVGNLASLADFDVDVYYSDYARAVLAAGGMPFHLPIDVEPADVAEHLDGLLLSGGADIAPDRYGAKAETDLYPPELDRDAFELAMLDQAVARKLPTLGICRGLQMINVHAGGSLHQHVPEHAAFDQSTTHLHHEVTIEAESALGAMYGETRAVNSLHHQTVDQLGDGLRITARDGDGSVEGLEHADLPIVAVQWHPEMLPTAPTDPVFGWLVAAARG